MKKIQKRNKAFANAVAYYMKLTYSNWHKELVHDENIQAELQSITDGELEFNNRPFVKHRTDNRPERDDYGNNNNNRNNFRKNFGGRNNGGGRDNAGGNRGGGKRQSRRRKRQSE
jgi:hypothetical protein